jgi:DNA-binding MarR family transcriptional regulator
MNAGKFNVVNGRKYMEQLLSLFLKHALKPLLFDSEISEIEKKVSRSELIALLMLKQRKQSTMSQLAADLGAPVSTLTNISQRLSKRGWIERKRDANDKRVILVTLTPDGEMLADRILEVIKRILKRVEEALTPEELQQFIPLLLKVVKAVQNADPPEKREKAASKRIRIE